MNQRSIHQIAQQLAHRLQQSNGGVVLLDGAMGAGKTTLVAAVVKELDPNALPCSPTFTLINQYNDHLFHADLYRLTESCPTDDAFAQAVAGIGLWDLIVPGNIVLIEWPNGLTIPGAIRVQIKVKENGEREFIID